MRQGMLVVLILALPALATAEPAKRATITVEMRDFRNDKGYMRIALFDSKEGFPDKPKLALRADSGRIKDGRARHVFTGIPYGTYAVAVLHDENGNGKMDTNWVGIPKEGGGASRNPKPRFGPPDFEDAAFRLKVRHVKLRIIIRY